MINKLSRTLMQITPKYHFYATLLDAFRNYAESDSVWEKYWGWSENPPHSPEEFRELQYKSMLDTLNRVPFDSEAADRGTAFNEVIDCLIENRNSDKVEVEKLFDNEARGLVALRATYNNRVFDFPIEVCRELARYYRGAMTQQFVEGVLHTSLGDVRLYGYIDELMPRCIHDIKTTGAYSMGKYKNNYQHLVYPFALMESGNDVRDFEYNVVEFAKNGSYKTYTEFYSFVPERDVPRLRNICEELIRFVEENRHLITNQKIFGL